MSLQYFPAVLPLIVELTGFSPARPIGPARRPGAVHDTGMPALSPSGELETNRLVLRTRRVDEAAIYRQLWTERDPRVPAHRRVDPEGRPTIRDVAGWIRTENDGPGSGLLAVVRKVEGDVIGYCGLTFDRDARAGEAGLAYELLQRVYGLGYATEAAQAIVTWAAQVGYERLWATVRAWNSASRRVLEKLAFVETGQIEHDSVHGDSLLTVKELGSRRPA